MQHLMPNTTLQGGKYRIERMLGQGGFGITYLARNTVFDIDVAIKEFFMKDENDRNGSSVTMPNTTKQELFHGQMEKFKKEAKRMFAIKNEHIVGVQDLFEENGTAYYVMDYVDGENLAERLKRTGKPMSEQEVRDILPQILDALKSIHDAGIWHLDLKPANIMLTKEGKVKLIDFGASKQLNAQKGGATTSTAISYTNGYAPREQMEQNYDKFGPWTDIYALGATLYNLLTNKRPPLPTDIDDDMSEDKHEALPFPESVGGLRFLVLQMMKTNRLQRPQSIDAITVEKDKELSSISELRYTQNSHRVESMWSTDGESEETFIADSKRQKEDKEPESKQDSKADSRATRPYILGRKMWLIPFIILVVLLTGFTIFSFLGSKKEIPNRGEDLQITDEPENIEYIITDTKESATDLFLLHHKIKNSNEDSVYVSKAKQSIISLERKVVGRHPLMLWRFYMDYFGTCEITKTSDGKYRCIGFQKTKDNSDYIKLDGYISISNENRLRFAGKIKTMIHNLNDGKEHVEEGTFDFIAPDTEQCWRLSGTNDHLDIYFSKK